MALALVCVYFSSPAAAEPSESEGAKLLDKQGCMHCHYLRGKGGLVGPPFEGIRKYRSEDDIISVLTKKRPLPPSYPKTLFDPAEFMRHVQLDKRSAKLIAEYLLSVPDEEALELKGHDADEPDSLPQGFNFKPKPPSELSRKGMEVYKESGCAACHSIAGSGGWRGPSLDGVSARLSKNAIENRITRGATVFFSGKEYKPSDYSMPPAQLPMEEVKQISEFLMTLPNHEKKKSGK
jgi:mono/diheme cytochrome c family protein